MSEDSNAVSDVSSATYLSFSPKRNSKESKTSNISNNSLGPPLGQETTIHGELFKITGESEWTKSPQWMIHSDLRPGFGLETEDPYGCSYINEYHHKIKKEASGIASVNCHFTDSKGRILLSTRDYEPGDVMLEEPPLQIVQDSKGNLYYEKLCEIVRNENLDYDPLSYWCALTSLTNEDIAGHRKIEDFKWSDEEDDGKDDGKNGKENLNFITTVTKEQQKKLLLLYHGEIKKPTTDVKTIIKQLQLDPKGENTSLEILVKSLLDVWLLNSFEFEPVHGHPVGCSIYFIPSFMSHSCYANVTWDCHYENGNTFVARACREVKKGDEICCSYIEEDALFKAAHIRRDILEKSKHFICTCERCGPHEAKAGDCLDYSRGFCCPRCKIGVIFPDTLNTSESGAYFRCNNCIEFDHKLDGQKLCKAERDLEKKFKYWKAEIEKHGVGVIVKWFEPVLAIRLLSATQIFQQHWLMEKYWGFAQEFYDQQRDYDKAIHYCKLRILFFHKAYPGVSGSYAWALEGLGDLNFKLGCCDRNPKYFDISIAEYGAAMSALSVMFGQKHDYYKAALHKKDRVFQKKARLLKHIDLLKSK